MPRATWRETRKAELRERIYTVSVRLLRKHGLDGVSIERITREIGIAKGTFFNHFESKEHIIVEWHRRLTNECMAEVEATRFRTARGAIDAFTRHQASWAERHGDFVRLKARVAPTSQLLRETERELDDGIHRFLGVHIEAGKERGELRDDLDARFFSSLLLDTLRSTSRRWAFGDEPGDLVTAVKRRVAFLYRAATSQP